MPPLYLKVNTSETILMTCCQLWISFGQPSLGIPETWEPSSTPLFLLHVYSQLTGLGAEFPATSLVHYLLFPDQASLIFFTSPVWFSSWLPKWSFKHTNLVIPHLCMASYAHDKNQNAEHGLQVPAGIDLCLSLTIMALSLCALIILTSVNSLITPSWTTRHLVNSFVSFRSQLKPTCTVIPLTSRPSELPSLCVLLILHASSSFLIFFIDCLSLWTEKFRSHFSLA